MRDQRDTGQATRVCRTRPREKSVHDLMMSRPRPGLPTAHRHVSPYVDPEAGILPDTRGAYGTTLERHASVAGFSAGTARAPPAGLRPTSPARDSRTRRALRAPARRLPRCLPRTPAARPQADRGGACSRRVIERWTAVATRSTSPKSAGAPLRRLEHEEPRRPPRAALAPRSRT